MLEIFKNDNLRSNFRRSNLHRSSHHTVVETLVVVVASTPSEAASVHQESRTIRNVNPGTHTFRNISVGAHHGPAVVSGTKQPFDFSLADVFQSDSKVRNGVYQSNGCLS